MKKGDKVKVLPNKKYGVVDRVENGVIYLKGSNRPYMRGQLAYADEEPTPNDDVISEILANYAGRTIEGEMK